MPVVKRDLRADLASQDGGGGGSSSDVRVPAVIGSQDDTLGATDSMAFAPHPSACGKDGPTGHVAGDKLHFPDSLHACRVPPSEGDAVRRKRVDAWTGYTRPRYQTSETARPMAEDV